MEFTCEFSEKRSREINKLKDEKDSVFIKISSKLELWYQLVIRLKAIEYQKNFFLLFIFLLLSPG